MSRADALRADLVRAVDALEAACSRVSTVGSEDTLLRDGLIQRFEFSFEIAWKAIQVAAAAEGVTVRSPRTSLAHALQSGWAHDEVIWFRMLEARNLSAHTYDEALAQRVAGEIPSFLPLLRSLISLLPPP